MTPQNTATSRAQNRQTESNVGIVVIKMSTNLSVVESSSGGAYKDAEEHLVEVYVRHDWVGSCFVLLRGRRRQPIICSRAFWEGFASIEYVGTI